MSDTWTPAEAEEVIVALGGGMDQIDGVQLTVAQARALAARLAEVEAENARLRELYDNGRRDAAQGWTIDHLMECEEALRSVEARCMELEGEKVQRAIKHQAERDRLAQELEGLLGFLREVADRRLGKRDTFLSLQLEIRYLLARFPREGDEG